MEDSFQKLDDMHFNLVVIGQPPPLEGAIGLDDDLLRVHVIPADPVNEVEFARAQIVQPSFYLLRPDGHVGLAGAHAQADAIAAYLDRHLRRSASQRVGATVRSRTSSAIYGGAREISA